MRSVRAFVAIVLMAALAAQSVAAFFVPSMARARTVPSTGNTFMPTYERGTVGPPTRYIPASRLGKSAKDPRHC
jgi:hypothetical protein